MFGVGIGQYSKLVELVGIVLFSYLLKKFYKIVARVLAAGHHKEDESGHLNFQSLPLNSWISGLGRGSNVF